MGLSAALREELQERLNQTAWTLQSAATGAAALEILWQQGSDVVLLAPQLPDLHAEEFRLLLQQHFPDVQVLPLDALTPGGNGVPRAPETACSAEGPSPVQEQASDPVPAVRGWEGILGVSAAMQQVFRAARLVAGRDTTVLIQGESGTGKDLLARAIHRSSQRHRQPFVVINCAAIPEALLEAELFGYTKGAFTGASQARMGRVYAAHGGTLFLDEIGDMPLPLQSKILRFLEQGEVQRIGGSDTLKVDCRVIAATNADLRGQMKAHQFREDLFYRLAVMPIAVPPLRARMEDLDLLCGNMLERFCPGKTLHKRARQLLLEHPWPGNVRELRNVLERASLFAESRREILPEDIVL